MPTPSRLILLCSEGHGRGKGIFLRSLGWAFEKLGHQAAYAVPEDTPASAVFDDADSLLDAPRFSLPRESRLKNIATCGDLLFNQGFGSVDTVEQKILDWSELLTKTKPDLVVSDWAPSATLAARGQIPVLVTGNAFFSPPSHVQQFPLLHDLAPVQVKEDRILMAINEVLSATGGELLRSLPQLFEGHSQAVRTFSCLDPYAQLRLPNSVFPPAADLSRLVGKGDEIFVYIWLPFNQYLLNILVDALCRLDRPVRTYSVSYNQEQYERLRAAGVIVETVPVDQEAILLRSRLVVHGGGAMLAGLLAAAAMPQVILPRSVEDFVLANTLEAAGGCRSLRLDMTDSEKLSHFIAEAYDDSKLLESVQIMQNRLVPAPSESWAEDIAAVGDRLL